MKWTEFSTMRQDLDKVLFNLNSKYNRVNFIKEGITEDVSYFNTIHVVFSSITQENFMDLTYRHIVSDKKLEEVKLKIDNYVRRG